MNSGQIPTLFWRDWTLAPGPDLLAAAAATIYLLAARRVRSGWPWIRSLAFLAGIATVLIATQSGIDAYDDYLLSDHMVQHLLLLELAPLLLLLGDPVVLGLRSLPPSRRPSAARAIRRFAPLTHPLSCLAIYWIVVGATHLPAFYDATLSEQGLHDFEHVLYLAAGLLMWWPVVGADPNPNRRLGGVLRLVYMSLAMLPMTVIGVLLSRDPTVFYRPYAYDARSLGISAAVDQQQAGAIMWVIGSSFMAVTGIWLVMSALSDEERRMHARERRADRATAQSVEPTRATTTVGGQ